MTRRPAEFDNFPLELHPEFGPYRGICRHVVDGDTLDALLDLGCNVFAYQVIRLLGIDTPEINRAWSREAGLAARARLIELVPLGAPVCVSTHPNPDSFGRYLAVVATISHEDVGAVLVAEGYAVPWVAR